MRLEDVTAEIRPRVPWESIDLGCSLARRHIGAIWKAWALTVVPLWLVLSLLLHQHPVLLLLCIWWLKPLYDRVTLMVVSRALFGAVPSASEVVKAWPGMLVKRFWFTLFIGRFSPARSLTLPVAELEGLRGKAYRQRVNLLERNGGEGATMATLAGMFLGLIAGIGLMMTVMIMVPGHVSAEWWQGFTDFFIHANTTGLSVGFFWLAVGMLMFATMVMEPFYLSAGFALYINSRTLTEGWDIELAFKRLGGRLTQLRSGAGSKMGVLLFTLFFSLALGEVSQGCAAEDSYQASVREILAGEDFKVYHRDDDVPVDKTKSGNTFLDKLAKLLAGAGIPSFMATVGMVLFFVILAAVIGWIIYIIIRNKHVFQTTRRDQRDFSREVKTESVMGMDVRPESLPTDVVAASRQAWSEEDGRLALSLLYRGSIAWLVHREVLPIQESDTEGDCLRRVNAVGELTYEEYFAILTSAWVNVAYGEKGPSDSKMKELCDRWPFGRMNFDTKEKGSK